MAVFSLVSSLDIVFIYCLFVYLGFFFLSGYLDFFFVFFFLIFFFTTENTELHQCNRRGCFWIKKPQIFPPTCRIVQNKIWHFKMNTNVRQHHTKLLEKKMRIETFQQMKIFSLPKTRDKKKLWSIKNGNTTL